MTRVGDWEIVVISGRDGMYATTTTPKYGTDNKYIKLQHLHQLHKTTLTTLTTPTTLTAPNINFLIVGKVVMECPYIRDGYHEPITG